jgi:DNA-binding NarL/FixJ family response regulator
MRISHLFDDPGLRAILAHTENEARQRIESLTPQQMAVLEHMIDGHPNKVIAFKMGLSIRTVENHRLTIHDKLGTKSTMALARMIFLAS